MTLAAHGIESCDHLLSFLQANPNISKKIQMLKLSGETLDDSAMAKPMALLPSLANLELGRFIHPPPPSDSTPRQDSPGPFALNTFDLNTLYIRPDPLDYTSSISGFFRILSLFHIEKLTMCHWHGRHCEFDSSTPLDPRFLHRPLRINKLSIGPYPRRELDVKCIPFFTNAFGDGIEPGSLQNLKVRADSGAAVSAIGNLLMRAGGELKSLTVDGDGPHPGSKRSGWEDPLDKHWHTRNLAACPKLESIKIYIYFRAPCDAPQPQNIPVLSLAGAGMLSEAPSTLRKVAIFLWDLPRVTTLNNRRMLRLQAFDKVITPSRFPVMEGVRVGVMPDWGLREKRGYEWEQVVAGVQKALPSLHSRGLLKVSWNP